MQKLEFGLLGPLEALRDGVPLPLGTRKQRALLALLLLDANAAVSPDRLLDEIATTRRALHVYVARLRRTLGAETIARRPAGYALCVDPSRIDVTSFERLVTMARHAAAPERSRLLGRALAVWRGPALADFSDERFARPAVARLEEMRLCAEESRIEAELELQRQAYVVPRLAALVVEHPYRERLRALLMTALYRLGRQAEALAVYRDARNLLVEELGVEPTPLLRDAERAILRQGEE